MIFQDIYGCLDLGLPEIIDFYVPTLRPEDNIDIIYRKQNQRNKKSRKQIKEFHSEYMLFLDKRAYMQKRKMLRNKNNSKNKTQQQQTITVIQQDRKVSIIKRPAS